MTKQQEKNLLTMGVPKARVAKLKASGLSWAKILKLILTLLASLSDDDDE